MTQQQCQTRLYISGCLLFRPCSRVPRNDTCSTSKVDGFFFVAAREAPRLVCGRATVQLLCPPYTHVRVRTGHVYGLSFLCSDAIRPTASRASRASPRASHASIKTVAVVIIFAKPAACGRDTNNNDKYQLRQRTACLTPPLNAGAYSGVYVAL